MVWHWATWCWKCVGVWCWSALKESGYESDSTLVFKRRDETAAAQQPSLAEQRIAYKTIQRGGEVPLHGLRKPAPERPKGLLLLLFAFPSTPAPTTQKPSHSNPVSTEVETGLKYMCSSFLKFDKRNIVWLQTSCSCCRNSPNN